MSVIPGTGTAVAIAQRAQRRGSSEAVGLRFDWGHVASRASHYGAACEQENPPATLHALSSGVDAVPQSQQGRRRSID
eukprot:3932847-Rhodomonas_salina.6